MANRRLRAATDTDADENPNDLIAALDATLDQASVLAQTVDLSTVPPDVGQALTLVFAAEALADQLMDLYGIYDPDDTGPAEKSAPDKAVRHPREGMAVSDFGRRLGSY